MVTVTISVPEDVYAWLADKASVSKQSVETLIVDQVQRLSQGDPDNPEFVAAMNGVISANRNLLKRLAE